MDTLALLPDYPPADTQPAPLVPLAVLRIFYEAGRADEAAAQARA